MRDSTRETLIQTVLDLSAMAGLRELTVRQVCEAAGVVPRTFYGSFGTLQSAFAEGYRQLDRELEGIVLDAYRRFEDPEPCAEACVDAALGFVRRDQMTAEAFFVHGFAAGAEVAAMRAARVAWLEELVAVRMTGEGRDRLTPTQRFSIELAIGGVLAIVHAHVGRGDLEGLAAARPRLIRALLPPVAPRSADALVG